VLADVVAKLKLDGIPEPQKKIRAIERFFRDPANHFRYTLNLPRRRERVNQPTALGYFLTNSFAAIANTLPPPQCCCYARPGSRRVT